MGNPRRKLTGKFWPAVRARIWEMAEALHTQDFYASHEENITPPTRRELMEGGYFYRAKCLVLRDVRRELRGPSDNDGFKPPTFEEWQESQRN